MNGKTNRGSESSDKFLGQLRGTIFEYVPIYVAAIIEFVNTIRSIMTKFLATETLNNTQITILWLSLCSVGHENK